MVEGAEAGVEVRSDIAQASGRSVGGGAGGHEPQRMDLIFADRCGGAQGTKSYCGRRRRMRKSNMKGKYRGKLAMR